jgi:hypothetical protein
MRTEELVAMLATGAQPVDARTHARRYAAAIALGTLVAILLTASALGIRTTWATDLALSSFWTKEIFCLTLASAGVAMVARVARPGTRLGLAPLGVALPLLAIGLLAGNALVTAAPDARAHLLFGRTALVCPFLIAMVSVPMFAAFLWSLRDMAPTRLRLAGTVAGFAAGASGALVYSLHCPELSAPFVAAWYLLGMLIPTAVGALLGPRLLRW